MTTRPTQDHPASPCIRRCAIDPASGYCSGCLRSLDEIAGWSAMTPEQQRAILTALPARRAARAR